MVQETLLALFVGILILAYPVSWIICRVIPPRRLALHPLSHLPRFTIVVAAYNEEEVILQKIENFKKLEYDPEKLDLIIVSDLSTDRTQEIVREHESSRIRLMNYGERLGKTRILNRTIPHVAGDIVVNTDANVMFEADTIQRFANWFVDPAIGLVCGYEERRVPTEGNAIRTESFYRDFEVRIKCLESRLGAVQGAHGGMYAIRRECWTTLPDNALSNDDLLTGMNVLKQGYRVHMDPDARALEITGTRLSEEFRRRVRIGAGNYQAFWWHRWLLNPLQGWKSFFFWVHKMPRWFTPHLMLLVLALSITLRGTAPWVDDLLRAQAVFYGLTLFGLLLDRLRLKGGLLMAPYHFCMMNLAVFLGFFKWLGGIRSSTWTPTQRD